MASGILRMLATVGKSEVEESIIKSTFGDGERPKEKHVQRLVEISHSRIDLDVAEPLTARLSSDSWMVVLKTLCVIHRICKDGDTSFMLNVLKYAHTLNLGKLDRSSTLAWGHARMTRSYAEYLAEKLYVFRVIGTSGERMSQREIHDWVNKWNMDEVVKYIPLIQHQFDLLLQIRPYVDDNDVTVHPIAAMAFKLLIIDSSRLHSILHISYLRLVESAAILNREQIITGLESYKAFVEQNKVFERWGTDLEHHELVSKNVLPVSVEELSQGHGFVAVMTNLLRAHDPAAAASIVADDEIQGGVYQLSDLLGDSIQLVVSRDDDANTTTGSAAAASSSSSSSKKKKKKKKQQPLQGGSNTSLASAGKSESAYSLSQPPKPPTMKKRTSASEFDLFDLSHFNDNTTTTATTTHTNNNNNSDPFFDIFNSTPSSQPQQQQQRKPAPPSQGGGFSDDDDPFVDLAHRRL